MRIVTVATVTAGAVGVIAIMRQRREAAGVSAGRLHALGPDTVGERDEAPHDRLHALVAAWRPAQPRSASGRVAATIWALPLTALGAAATFAGGAVPHRDAVHGCLLATKVRGPAGWFLRSQGAAAATLGQVVVALDADPRAVLLAHESVHVRQQERLGLAFALAYPLAQARWGYRDNPFEVAARRGATTLSSTRAERAVPSPPTRRHP